MQNRPENIATLTHPFRRHRRRIIAASITGIGLLCLFIASIVFFPNKQMIREPSFSSKPGIPLGSEVVTTQPSPTELKKITLTTSHITVKTGDSLSHIFDDLHLSPKQLQDIMKTAFVKTAMKRLHPGQQLEFIISGDEQLQTLIMPLNSTEDLLITRTDTGFTSKTEIHKVDISTRVAQAIIESSFYLAGHHAHVPKKILMNFVKIFSWRFDFSRDIKKGDRFSVLYEIIKNMKTDKSEPSNIIAAEFTHNKKSTYAFRYRDNLGRVGYYDVNGKSLRKAFIRKPVINSYISSPFNLHRRHPLLHIVRPHTGTDFAANYGTPIHATGDGRITLMRRKGGYGRCVVINHGNGITTLYAHMSRFNKKLRAGSYVKMNDVIGYIGSSGTSTGPHVHYEYRIKGHYQNPMKVALPNASPIPKSQRVAYKTYVTEEMKQLNKSVKV